MHLIVKLLVVIMPVLQLTGCIRFYKYQDVTFKVVDAETGAPIEGAALKVGYAAMFEIFRPDPVEAVTPPEGLVTLRVTNWGGEFPLTVTASDYIWLITDRLTIRKQLEDDPFRRVVLPDGFVNTIELFAKPRPTGTLVLPQGFEGLLRYPKDSDLEIEQEPGQREFTVQIGDDGIIRLPSTGVAMYTEWETRYPDNTLVPSVSAVAKTPPTTVARYWIGICSYGLLEYIGDYATAQAAHLYVEGGTFNEGGGVDYEGGWHRGDLVWEQGLSAIPDLP